MSAPKRTRSHSHTRLLCVVCVAASTVVWSVSRIAYWIGYQIAPKYRLAGLCGSMIHAHFLNMYTICKFGHELYGSTGAAICGGIYALGQILIT